MPRFAIAELALRLIVGPSPTQYVCRTCRAQAVRQFHTPSRRAAEVPFWKRMQQTIFGSKESKEAEQSREEQRKRRLEDLSQQDPTTSILDKRTDRRGREYEVAAVVDPTINSDYVQAANWDGLESVGSADWVKARADQGEQYAGFIPKRRMELTNRQWEKLLHHITVEVLALRQAGRILDDICNARQKTDNPHKTRTATIRRGNGQPGVTLKIDEGVEKAIPATEDTTEESADLLAPEEQALTQEVYAAVGGDDLAQYTTSIQWMDMRLADPQIKLAIVKRAVQLSGKRIPDHALSNATTIADLHEAFKTKEKPKKLTQAPQMEKLKVAAPNVAVYATRRTPIHKEKEIGRWKVIEEELLRRDLPVTGSRWQGAKTTVE